MDPHGAASKMDRIGDAGWQRSSAGVRYPEVSVGARAQEGTGRGCKDEIRHMTRGTWVAITNSNKVL